MSIQLNDSIYAKAPKPLDLKTFVGAGLLFNSPANIPIPYRYVGMRVVDLNFNKTYKLVGDKVTWVEIVDTPAWVKDNQVDVQLSEFGGNLDITRIDNLSTLQFLNLGDVDPSTYVGNQGKAVIVNSSETGVTFGIASGGSGDAVWGSITGTLENQSDLDVELKDKMLWRNTWVNATYLKNSMVYSRPYIGIALNNTSDIFPPQKSGLPEWKMLDNPPWDIQTVTGDVATGVDFTVPYMFGVEQYRFWVNTQVGVEYTILSYEYINGKFELINRDDFPSGSTPGWYIVTSLSSRILQKGEHFRVVLINHDTTNDVSTATTYNWRLGLDYAENGGISVSSGFMYISTTDDDGGDRTALISSIKEDDKIKVNEEGSTDRTIFYMATGDAVAGTNEYIIPIILISSGREVRDDRIVDAIFTITQATNTDYVRIVDGNLGNPYGVKGFITQNAEDLDSPDLILDNNQYGIDLYIQEYSTSPNWFYINVGSGGTSGGGDSSPGIEIVDDLVTQDSTKALSANQGYILDQLKLGRTLIQIVTAAGYSTANNDTDSSKQIYITGGSITLEDLNLTVGFNQVIVNSTGSDMSVILAAGNTILGTPPIILPINKIAVIYLVEPTIWAISTDNTVPAHDHDTLYYRKTEFIDTSTGAPEAGLPIVLDAAGLIDSSMLPSGTGVLSVTGQNVDNTDAINPIVNGLSLVQSQAMEAAASPSVSNPIATIDDVTGVIGLQNIVEDLTPQLGADLDGRDFSLINMTTFSGKDIKLLNTADLLDIVYAANEYNINSNVPLNFNSVNLFTADTLFDGGIIKYNDTNPLWEGSDIANKTYIFTNYTPLLESGTAGESLASGNIVYKGVDDKWYKASNNIEDQVSGRLGFVFESNVVADELVDITFDREDNSVGFTPGAPVYLAIGGGVTQTLPTGAGVWVKQIGSSSTSLLWHFNSWGKGYVKADGSQVDGVAVGGGANLDYIATPTDGTITSNSGTNATVPLATDNDAGLLAPAEKLRIEDIGKTFVDNFLASSNQTSYIVTEGSILDNGQCSIQVGANMWNSRTGITSFPDGNLSIDFINGKITFHFALQLNTQVIIKYGTFANQTPTQPEAEHVTDIVTFKNQIGTWVNTPNNPLTVDDIILSEVGAGDGYVACIYYKGNVLDKSKFLNSLILSFQGSNTLNQLCSIFIVYDKLQNAYQVNITDSFTGDLPPINQAPIITMIGNSPVTVLLGDPYNDQGATALDAEDGDITNNIVIFNPVDVNTENQYAVTYNVVDSNGLAAIEVIRIVNVILVIETSPVLNITDPIVETSPVLEIV